MSNTLTILYAKVQIRYVTQDRKAGHLTYVPHIGRLAEIDLLVLPENFLNDN
jgi:hypothetical protein